MPDLTICPKCQKPGNLIDGMIQGQKQKVFIYEHGANLFCLLDEQPKTVKAIKKPLAEPPSLPNVPIPFDIALPPTSVVWLRDFIYAQLMGYSIKQIKDACNPDKDPHYSASMFHLKDRRPFGKGWEILYNPSINEEENRPRILQRPKRPKPGNPNFQLRKKMGNPNQSPLPQ